MILHRSEPWLRFESTVLQIPISKPIKWRTILSEFSKCFPTIRLWFPLLWFLLNPVPDLRSLVFHTHSIRFSIPIHTSFYWMPKLQTLFLLFFHTLYPSIRHQLSLSLAESCANPPKPMTNHFIQIPRKVWYQNEIQWRSEERTQEGRFLWSGRRGTISAPASGSPSPIRGSGEIHP